MKPIIILEGRRAKPRFGFQHGRGVTQTVNVTNHKIQKEKQHFGPPLLLKIY